MVQTPQEWLPILAKRMDERAPLIAKRRRYADGNADLPEMGRNTRASWEAFQKKARTNYGGMAVRSLRNRIRAVAVTVGSDENSPELDAARRIFRDNRMVVQIADGVLDALVCGVGYLVNGFDEGGAVVTRERPEQFYAEPDPLRPWRARAAVKVWRDRDAGLDYALVWIPGVVQSFSRRSSANGVVLRGVQGDWTPGEATAYAGGVPVGILEGEDPRGFIEPHFDTIDRINLGKLQRLVVTAMQAYRQRALKTAPGSPGVPEQDENGNAIDFEEMFAPAPGALWDLPEGVDVWESQGFDIRPLLDGEKQDARDFAAETGTPIVVFIPDGQNQTAEGAHTAKEQQIFTATDYITRFAPAVDAVMVRALAVEGFDLGGKTLAVEFANPAHVSLTERYASAAQAKAAGESWKSIARNVLGYSPEQIAKDAADRAEEQLSAATLVAAVTPPQQQPAQTNAAVA